MQTMLETNMANTTDQHLDTRDHVTAETTKVMEHFDSGLRADNMRKDEERIRTRLLSTLWFPEMNDRENRIKEVTEETVEWIFFEPTSVREYEIYGFDPETAETNSTARDPPNQPTKFQEWLHSSQPMFWICGKPGSGKSSLMKYLIKNRRTREYLGNWKPEVIICQFFFIEICVNPLQRQLRGCLRTLLHQIWHQKPGILDRLLLQMPQLETKHSEHDWSLEELQRVLIHSVKDNDLAFCIFIDGLDEIDAKSEDRDTVIELVKRLADLANVKICVSSRPENIFQQSLGSGDYPFLKTETLNRPGIISYAEKALTRYQPSGSDDLHHFSSVVTALVVKSAGVFLWIHLATRSVIDGIRNKDGWAVISERTNDLESDLNQLYQQMWQRQNLNHERYKKDTARLLWHSIHADNLILLSPPIVGFGTILAYIMGTHEALRADILRLRTPRIKKMAQDLVQAEEARIFTEYEAWLSARSAGLLEIQSVTAMSSSVLENTRATTIHRSVDDFLLDTVDGREIISYGQASMKQRLLQTLDVVKWVSCCGSFCSPEQFTAAVVSLAEFGMIDSDEELNLLTDFETCYREAWGITPSYINMARFHGISLLDIDMQTFAFIVFTTSSTVYLSHMGQLFKSFEKASQVALYRTVLELLRIRPSSLRRNTFRSLICFEHWTTTGARLPISYDYTYLSRHVRTLQWFLQSSSFSDLIHSEIQLGPLKLNSDTFYQYLWPAAYSTYSALFPYEESPEEYLSIILDCLVEYEQHAYVLDHQICFFAAPAKDKLVYSWDTGYDKLVAKYSNDYDHAIVFCIRTQDLSESCHALARVDAPEFTHEVLREKLRNLKFHVKCLAVRNGKETKESKNPAGWRTPSPKECDVVCPFFEDRLLKDVMPYGRGIGNGNPWESCVIEGDFSMLIPGEI